MELHTFIIKKSDINKKTLVDIFNIDCDFSENKEYFRVDTIKLGYSNESERCAEEVYNACKHIKGKEFRLYTMIRMAIEYSIDSTTFIVGNETHTRNYKFTITHFDNYFIVSIAYVLN